MKKDDHEMKEYEKSDYDVEEEEDDYSNESDYPTLNKTIQASVVLSAIAMILWVIACVISIYSIS